MDSGNNDAGASFLGLGFGPSSVSSARTNHTSTAEDLMQHYLSQCLAYHQEKQDIKKSAAVRKNKFVAGGVEGPVLNEQQPPQNSDVPTESALTNATSVPEYSQFKNSVQNDPSTASSRPGTESHVVPPDRTDQEGGVSSIDDNMVDLQVEHARARAQAVLLKFQQQKDSVSDAVLADLVLPEAAQQRQTGLQREAARKHAALLKNLEYVAAKDAKRAIELAAQVEAARQAEAFLAEQHRATLEHRKRLLQHGGSNLVSQTRAGIGTEKRRRVEKSKAKQQQDASVAVYLSGLPVDGSVAEQDVRTLFAHYGTVRKVHFYRNRETDLLKGDGLVVFQVSGDGSELLSTVCGQLNGAELAVGVPLNVEPARSGSGKESATSGVNVDTTPRGQSVVGTPGEAQDTGADDDEDLDDFFDSLT